MLTVKLDLNISNCFSSSGDNSSTTGSDGGNNFCSCFGGGCVILVICFISGRKNTQLLPDNISQYDLLLRMFISSTYIGKGYGKLILQLFIQTYNKIISKSIKDNESGQSGKSGQSGQTGQSSTPIKITLFSDILKTNIPSIKTHLSNGFIFNNTIKYPNAKYYERYILDMDI